ncbi:unnamed protein product [Lactuca saligna]|uniref:EF-hand domain-containing protein n=1 Tax=Lactuca saligna TaxID=75948 RepID=A0AA35UTK4_LACSI|nr:unnamed protein product [Lactuca saligna]
MSVAFIDGPMLTKFVDDSAAFEKCIKERFDMLDVNKDGVLSRNELHNDINDVSSVESALQSKEEEVMIAKAHGFGNTPVCIILQTDSLLQKVV